MTTATTTNHALVEHLLRHSVRRGDFVLKSGRRSEWFIDAKQTTCRPDGMMLEAAEAVRAGGAEPVLLVPVVDRGGTVAALAADAGIELRALVTAPDLGFPYEKDVS